MTRALTGLCCFAALNADRKRLKAEKLDVINQMKQLFATIEDKEKELREFIRAYEKVLIRFCLIKSNSSHTSRQNSKIRTVRFEHIGIDFFKKRARRFKSRVFQVWCS